jgi:hypothetical protein
MDELIERLSKAMKNNSTKVDSCDCGVIWFPKTETFDSCCLCARCLVCHPILFYKIKKPLSVVLCDECLKDSIQHEDINICANCNGVFSTSKFDNVRHACPLKSRYSAKMVFPKVYGDWRDKYDYIINTQSLVIQKQWEHDIMLPQPKNKV